ncbi:PaaI family thioesterase [Corynebacterium heidelbergense]|uniref:PaaI family thioesterase n=1 Tax=Corynebacterium heidelbergense TaxID=2055947 RepID=UPI000DD65F27|nr:DUF4442 domain-containing protein [Corynebacterium heidelbergense]WCZ35638.1 hypothetical protein CHEID_00280 [Corynebacterium heidelbergense]
MGFVKNLLHPSRLAAQALSSPQLARRMMSAWTPLFGSGIRITHIEPDWSGGRLELRLNFLNLNMHAAAFGGTLFSMTDVLFGTLVNRRMGKDFEAWTRTGTFQFLTPGRNGAYLEVEVSDELIAWIKECIAKDGYCNVPYTTVVRNRDGSVVGIGQQDLHVRPRGGGKRAPVPEQARRPRGLVLEALATSLVWQAFRDHPETLTVLMSEQRRIPAPEEQMRHVAAAALEKSEMTREDLLGMGIPQELLPQ